MQEESNNIDIRIPDCELCCRRHGFPVPGTGFRSGIDDGDDAVEAMRSDTGPGSGAASMHAFAVAGGPPAAGGWTSAAAPQPERVLERLLIKAAAVTPTMPSDEVFAMFENRPDLRALAVVADGAPLGLISRYEMIDNLARPYRRELFGRKPCSRFMDPRPLMVDVTVSLEALAELIVDADPRQLVSGFIITNGGAYLGIGSVQALVAEVTAMQMQAARYANPLTQLPGNVPTNRHIDKLLSAGEPFCIAYCDLDHFKPFNDVHGYASGDAVIQLTARILAEACDPGRDYVGHIGGDDFVLVFRSEDWEARCRTALTRFDDAIRAFFSAEDVLRGGYISESRTGTLELHPLTALSIGAVQAEPGVFRSHLQVSAIAAEVKKRAKAIPGSSLYVNRRDYPVTA